MIGARGGPVLSKGRSSGEVTFTARATDGLRLIVGDKVVIDGLSVYGGRTGKVTMKKGEKTPITLEFTSAEGKAALALSWSWLGQGQTIVPAAVLSYKESPKIRPVDLMAYKAGKWLDFNVKADCGTGTYTLSVNGREVVKDAGFAEPSTMVYAISFRTGEFRGRPPGRADRDIPNTEEPFGEGYIPHRRRNDRQLVTDRIEPGGAVFQSSTALEGIYSARGCAWSVPGRCNMRTSYCAGTYRKLKSFNCRCSFIKLPGWSLLSVHRLSDKTPLFIHFLRGAFVNRCVEKVLAAIAAAY